MEKCTIPDILKRTFIVSLYEAVWRVVGEMLIKDMPKDRVNELISAISDLRPKMRVSVIAEDYALYQMGLIQYIPCTVEVEASEEEIFELLDEVEQMEIDSYNFDNNELNKSEVKKLQRRLLDRYSKYAVIEAYLVNYKYRQGE